MAISSPDQDPSRPCSSSPEGAEAEHLAKLPGGAWAVWRWAALRGTGFPAKMLLPLAASRCARTADELNEKDARARVAGETAVKSVQQAMDEAGLRHHSAKKTIQLLKKSELPEAVAGDEAVRTAISQWRRYREEFELARGWFREEFGDAMRQISERVREIAQRNDFREAVAWQNRQALQTGIDALLRRRPGEPRSSKLRQHEQLVANYLQRYCAKNDTIGFFGPVGWARFVPEGPLLRMHVGETLIARRNLYFESWCIDSLVERFGNRREVLPWIAPRANCAIYEENGKVYLPFRPPVRLTPAEAALLAACDGKRTANSIAAELVCAPEIELSTMAEIFGLLGSMQARGMIWWKFELPRELRPEVALRRAIARIGEERLRTPLESAIDELEEAFFNVRRAAGDAGKVSRTLSELEVTFNRLTGKSATRSAGQAYAGRTLVYEDCLRDAEVEIGPEILAATGPALALVLDSARWLSYAVSQSYRIVLRSVYTSLVKATATPQIDFVQFWARAQSYFFEGREAIVSVARDQFQKRWARILNLPTNHCRLYYASDAIKEAVAKEFMVPKRLGSFARYQSPDLLFAARGIDSLRAGRYQVVLGELHAGMNTLGWPLFIEQHPSPGDLFRAIDLDLPEPRLVPLVPKGSFGDVTRVLPALVSSKDYHLGLQTGAAEVADSRYIPIGSLILEDDDNELVLRTRDGRLRFDLLEGLGQFLEMATANQFKMLRLDGHLPRIAIDRLVVCRECWSFSLAELEFAFRKEEMDRYAEARKWAAQRGVPRFVFVRLPGEDKPVYIDFDSPIYVEILAKMIRRAANTNPGREASLTVTEMMPAIEENWLQDASGETYACELRMAAVDLLQDPSQADPGKIRSGGPGGERGRQEQHEEDI